MDRTWLMFTKAVSTRDHRLRRAMEIDRDAGGEDRDDEIPRHDGAKRSERYAPAASS